MRSKNIVTIGGGTGSFMLLSGLKKYPINISAIVSTADDGGSTGVLRDELGVLPPGDVRQCLVALSNSSKTFRELMSYRFENGGLKGHSFGNLLLSALEKIKKNFASGVHEASKILNVKGNVLPVTRKKTDLFIKLKNGKILNGQNEINHNYEIEKCGIEKIYLRTKEKANPLAIKSILEADAVVIGPGNHYCSIIPNLIVDGISEALRRTKAIVIYNCNLVNKKGHTEKFDLDDYVKSINKLIGANRINFVTFNTKRPSEKLIKKYESKKELLVGFESARDKNRKYKIICSDFLSKESVRYSKADAISSVRSFIRHDSDKLAKMLMMITELGEYENIIKKII
jgi:uncharacterized cofD-like protein